MEKEHWSAKHMDPKRKGMMDIKKALWGKRSTAVRPGTWGCNQ